MHTGCVCEAPGLQLAKSMLKGIPTKVKYEINRFTVSNGDNTSLPYRLHHPRLILTDQPVEDAFNQSIQGARHLPDAGRHLLEHSKDPQLLAGQGQPQGIPGSFRVGQEGQLLWI